MSLYVLVQTFSPTIYLQPKITHITISNLKDIVRDKDLVLLNVDKDSGGVLMNRTDYSSIMLKMTGHWIKNKMYEETTDNTLKDLKIFQDFLYRNIKDYENYDDMRPVSS